MDRDIQIGTKRQTNKSYEGKLLRQSITVLNSTRGIARYACFLDALASQVVDMSVSQSLSHCVSFSTFNHIFIIHHISIQLSLIEVN